MGDETPPLYPGFEEDARLWGLQTSAGERCVHRTGRASVACTAPRRGCMPLSACLAFAAGLTRHAVPLPAPRCTLRRHQRRRGARMGKGPQGIGTLGRHLWSRARALPRLHAEPDVQICLQRPV
jgi:hypothetical protein